MSHLKESEGSTYEFNTLIEAQQISWALKKKILCLEQSRQQHWLLLSEHSLCTTHDSTEHNEDSEANIPEFRFIYNERYITSFLLSRTKMYVNRHARTHRPHLVMLDLNSSISPSFNQGSINFLNLQGPLGICVGCRGGEIRTHWQTLNGQKIKAWRKAPVLGSGLWKFLGFKKRTLGQVGRFGGGV